MTLHYRWQSFARCTFALTCCDTPLLDRLSLKLFSLENHISRSSQSFVSSLTTSYSTPLLLHHTALIVVMYLLCATDRFDRLQRLRKDPVVVNFFTFYLVLCFFISLCRNLGNSTGCCVSMVHLFQLYILLFSSNCSPSWEKDSEIAALDHACLTDCFSYAHRYHWMLQYGHSDYMFSYDYIF